MRIYQLHVKVDGAWSWVCTIDAGSHAEAFEAALRCLGSADGDRPIRLEQDIEGAYRKPCRLTAREERPSAAPRRGRRS